MLRFINIAITLFLSSAIMAQSSVRMEIRSLPSYHPSGSDIYMAGSFNGWNPADEKYKFKKDDKGNYTIDLSLADGLYEYKITRGGWDKAECKKGGAGRENRGLKMPSDGVVTLAIDEWADRFPALPKVSTASKNVHIIDTAFWIPQLKRTRRIWIYLPENYNSDAQSRYPVLYMNDGQNVFDNLTAYAGEWAVDDFLDSTVLKKCIVVAIDHGEIKRMNEYNPYDHKRFGKGEGGKYVEFLAKTLKPFIDKRYRTFTDRKNTFIAGSSMGGLISLYAVLKCPDVFGGAGIFSPSFAVSGPKIFNDIRKKGSKVHARLYFYGGKQEDEDMVPNMLNAFETMSKVSTSVMTTVIRDEGRHNESRWRVEFPLFYEWLFSVSSTQSSAGTR